MPSLHHEILVEVFRNRPQLVCELLELVAGITVHAASVDAGSSEANQITPVEFRADRVLLMRDEKGAVIRAAVVEVQLAIDPDKRYSWPVYVAAARAERRCPALLLVMVPDDAVAAWARTPIELGHPGFALAPIVVCLEDLAEQRERAGTEPNPELTLLCALGHPDPDTALALAKAVFDEHPDLDKEHAAVYLNALCKYLPGDSADSLEAYVRDEKHEHLSNLARRYFDRGREEGREEGLQRAVLTLATAKLGTVPPHLVERIEAVRDCAALERLLEMMVHAADDAATLALMESVTPPG